MREPTLAWLRSTAGRVREKLRDPEVRALLRRFLVFLGVWAVASSLVEAFVKRAEQVYGAA